MGELTDKFKEYADRRCQNRKDKILSIDMGLMREGESWDEFKIRCIAEGLGEVEDYMSDPELRPKYYTPKIEEFHVGFEFEYKRFGQNWEKYIHEAPSAEIILANKRLTWAQWSEKFPKDFRVKYLDKEDIESLGFIDLGSLWFFKESCLTVNGTNFLNCKIRKWGGNQIDIYVDYHDQDKLELIFRGDIKNKSELKKILEQIGVTN